MPELVYPLRSGEIHGAASNAAIDRKSVAGSVSSAAAAGGTKVIGRGFFHTDFPPKEYGHSAGVCCILWHLIIRLKIVRIFCIAYGNELYPSHLIHRIYVVYRAELYRTQSSRVASTVL